MSNSITIDELKEVIKKIKFRRRRGNSGTSGSSGFSGTSGTSGFYSSVMKPISTINQYVGKNTIKIKKIENG